MTVQRPLFTRRDAVQGTSPLAARLALAGLIAGPAAGARPGVLRGLEVSGTSGWNYQVAAGHLVTVKSAADGAALWALSAPVTVGTSAAPASGSRIDIVYAAHNDIDHDDPDSSPVLDVAQGAPSGTPSAPSFPAGAIELRRFTIPSGATGTQGGTSSDANRQRTAAHGDPIPVSGAAQRNEIGWGSASNPARVLRLDTGAEEVNAGAGWTSPFGVWQTYSPSGGPQSLGGGATRAGKFVRIGSTIHGWGMLLLGDSGNINQGSGSYAFALPAPAVNPGLVAIGSAWLNDFSANPGRRTGTTVLFDANSCRIVLDDIQAYVGAGSPWQWSHQDRIQFEFTYEAAA